MIYSPTVRILGVLLVSVHILVHPAPLEIAGSGVYRQPRRLAFAVLPVAAVFLIWDGIAIAADVWTYNPRYVTGIDLPAAIPLEELLFFVVIPICAVLTYSAVDTILSLLQRFRSERVQRP